MRFANRGERGHLAEALPRTLDTCSQPIFQPTSDLNHTFRTPLATVRSLGPFSTIEEGRFSLVAEVQCLDLCTRRRRQRLQCHCQKRNDPSDSPQGSAQGKTGCVRAYLWEETVVNQLSDRQRASAQRMPTCATRIVCRVIYAQLPCACLSPFSLQACRLARRRSRRCVHLLIFVLAHVRVGAGGKEDSSAHVYSGSAYMQTWVFVSVHGCCFSDTDDVHATILFPHTHCVMRTCECIWAARWVCTHVSQHVGACIPLFCDTQRTLGTDKFQ